MKNRYHCCATCRHFSARKKEGGGMIYHCVRLGFETKTSYIFECWDPKDQIKRLIEREN